jgi:transcriptional regulator with XRE-family HTH domain
MLTATSGVATYFVVFRLYESYDSRSNMTGAGSAGKVWPNRLKEARLALGLSQKQLGIEAGLDEFVASTRINRYELGVHAPDYQMAARLAVVLQIPAAFLYCDDDEMAQMILAFHRAPKAARKRAMAALHAPV